MWDGPPAGRRRVAFSRFFDSSSYVHAIENASAQFSSLSALSSGVVSADDNCTLVLVTRYPRKYNIDRAYTHTRARVLLLLYDGGDLFVYVGRTGHRQEPYINRTITNRRFLYCTVYESDLNIYLSSIGRTIKPSVAKCRFVCLTFPKSKIVIGFRFKRRDFIRILTCNVYRWRVRSA